MGDADYRAPIPAGWPEGLAASIRASVDVFWRGADRDYENADNFRLCRIIEPEEVKAYVAIREKGCCAAFDEVWPSESGLVLYGFNYGH